MALHDKVQYNSILSNLRRELDRLSDKAESIKMDYALLYEANPTSRISGYAAIIAELLYEIEHFSSYWINYCKTFEEAYEKDLDIIQAEVDYNKRLLDKMRGLVDSVNNMQQALINQDAAMSKILNTVDENSASIVYNRATKVKGINNPNTKRGIRTEELIQDYIAAGLVLTDKIVAKYNSITPVTYHGLRKRLVDAGVWKHRS